MTAGLHDALQLVRDPIDHFDGARLAEHQQASLQPTHQLLPAVEARRIERAAHVLGDRFLDAREIEDALAQHSGLHLLEFGVLAGLGGLLRLRADQADETGVELVLDSDQRRGDLDQGGIVCLQCTGNDFVEPLGLGLYVGAQVTQAQHTEGVPDLAQHFDLRRELLRLPRSTAHEDIEHVLHLGEVFADRRGDRLHELHARCGQVLALLLDALIDRQQLGQAEGGTDGRHARTGRFRPAHVVQKIVQQLHRWGLRVTRLTLLVQAADFTIPQSEQSFDRHATLETVLAQRFDDRADHPPELEDRLARGDLLQLLGNGRDDVEVLLEALTAYPTDQADLITRAQPAGPLLHRHGRLARSRGDGLRLLVGLQVQQQQRALGEQ